MRDSWQMGRAQSVDGLAVSLSEWRWWPKGGQAQRVSGSERLRSHPEPVGYHEGKIRMPGLRNVTTSLHLVTALRVITGPAIIRGKPIVNFQATCQGWLRIEEIHSSGKRYMPRTMKR